MMFPTKTLKEKKKTYTHKVQIGREVYPSRGDDGSRGSKNRLVLDEGRRRGRRVKPSKDRWT